MNLAERILKILLAILEIFFSLGILLTPENGFLIVFAFLIFSFSISGLRILIYYFRLARFMVGGKKLFFHGIFRLDIGLLFLTTVTIPQQLLGLYVAATLIYTAAVVGYKAMSQKKSGLSSWKVPMLHCVIALICAILCLVFLNDHLVVLYVCAVSFFYDAGERILDSLKTNTVIFIQ